MPLSMALAGPVSAGAGLGATFVVAGLAPTVIAALAIVLAKMRQDEIAHPLDVRPDQDEATPADAPEPHAGGSPELAMSRSS